MDLSTQQLWQAVLGELELSISKANFTTWFNGTFILSFDIEKGRIQIGVPNNFTKAWLEKKYHSDIFKTIDKIIPSKIKDITYKVEKAELPHQKVTKPSKPVSEQTLQQIKQQFTAPTQQPNPKTANLHLNKNYTFETFVVGKNNELAHAAARAIANNPGNVYNPLFIYGGVGLGKTHLMQAVGKEMLNNNPNSKVLYVTSEEFTNDYISSLKQGFMEKFKSNYRYVDLLLIDDIQFLSGKDGTQEAFFHTFNYLHQNNKQVVISSDRPPKAIPSIEDRLISRFEWGMIADISYPDLETRLAIIKSKCDEKATELAEEIVNYVAANIENNVRELESALNKIIAYKQLNEVEPSMEEIKNILYSLSSASYGYNKDKVNTKHIITIVSAHFGLSLDEIVGKSREKRIALPRQIIMFLIREELKNSYPSIGTEIGGRDHTTAMHAYSKIKTEVEKDEKMRQEINILRQKLYNG